MTVLRMCDLGRCEPGWLVPLRSDGRNTGRRSGPAGRYPEDRPGVSLLWPPSDHRRTEAARVGSQPQTGGPHHAGGQSALPAAAPVRGDHGFQSRLPGVPESGQGHGTDRYRPALAGRHHLHQAGDGVRLSGGGAGRLLTPRDRLGAGPHSGGRSGDGSSENGIETPDPAGRTDPSFRSRRSVRLQRLHGSAQG